MGILEILAQDGDAAGETNPEANLGNSRTCFEALEDMLREAARNGGCADE